MSDLKRYLRVWFLLLFLAFFSARTMGQVTFSRIPQDLALVARDTATNKGAVIVMGQVDRSGSEPDYEKIRLTIKREGASYASNDSPTLQYTNDKASFTVSVDIDAEFANYSIEVYGLISGTPTFINLPAGTGNNIVAGDVFVIQGQSNAVALMQTPPGESSHSNTDSFIRTFASAVKTDGLLSQLYWSVANGDGNGAVPNGGGEFTPGYIGQWGLKLGRLLRDNPGVGVPVAIFNGGKGNTAIKFFLRDSDATFPQGETQTKNIYNRLYIRLDSTHLKDKVRAVIWSQGERDGFDKTTLQKYKEDFNLMKSQWLEDYPSIKKVYIFQTKSTCGGDGIMPIKEAQRQLAEEDAMIDLMQTTGITYANDCHFTFTNGYDEFANRIFKLIDRDFYGGTYGLDIEPPWPTKAYLIGPNSLIVETDQNLSSNNLPQASYLDFVINGAGLVTSAFSTAGSNKITINFTGSISSNATISYIGLEAGENQADLIRSTSGIELVCFDEWPINTNLMSVWDGGKWDPTAPNENMDAQVDSPYEMSEGSIIARDLEISSGVTVNFDSNSSESLSIIVYRDLILNGNLIIGDTESFIMNSTSGNVSGSGNFIKKEKTTPLDNMYDVTYWSAPVSGATLGSVFSDVDPNRIFYYDAKDDNHLYTGSYAQYRHWHQASGAMEVGRGYSVDGELTGSYPNHEMEVSFNGVPNYSDISISIGANHNNPDDDVDKVNLLGNPYPSAINPNQLISANSSNFEGALYLWSHQSTYVSGEYDKNDYFTFNLLGASINVIPSDYNIASGQGFMILTGNVQKTFVFQNSMMVANENTDFFKVPKKFKEVLVNSGRIWLKLRNEELIAKEILIGLSNQATDEYDKGFDAPMFRGNSEFYFYSMLDDQKLSIQSLNMYELDKVVALGFSAAEEGQYDLSISKEDGDFKNISVYVEDLYLNTTHDLKLGAYSFDSETGEYSDRFLIKYKKEETIEEPIASQYDFQIHPIENGFRINSKKEIRQIKAFDILGRLIYQSHPNDNEAELKINQKRKGSVILIQAIFSNNKQFVRKAILL